MDISSSGRLRRRLKIGLTIMEEKVYFEFLQVAVGNRESLSGGISDADWLRLFDFCKKQALIGVGFTSVDFYYFLIAVHQKSPLADIRLDSV